jgi:DNA helicase-2/ATP-dependent DNA helicase PcrA
VDDERALEEERRLLYVGITRARVHLILSWADRRTGNTGREGRRRPSRFLDDLLPPRGSRIVQLPDGVPSATRPRSDESPLMQALRAWRTARARTDAIAPFIVAHDSMLIAIADAQPASIAELRRVKGMGPSKLDRYGEEILAVIAAERPR